jgi:hypothetical protein
MIIASDILCSTLTIHAITDDTYQWCLQWLFNFIYVIDINTTNSVS